MLAQYIREFEFYDQVIAEFDEWIEGLMFPFLLERTLLKTIPGIGRRTTEQLVAELGVDMGQFPANGTSPRGLGWAPGTTRSPGNA